MGVHQRMEPKVNRAAACGERRSPRCVGEGRQGRRLQLVEWSWDSCGQLVAPGREPDGVRYQRAEGRVARAQVRAVGHRVRPTRWRSAPSLVPRVNGGRTEVRPYGRIMPRLSLHAEHGARQAIGRAPSSGRIGVSERNRISSAGDSGPTRRVSNDCAMNAKSFRVPNRLRFLVRPNASSDIRLRSSAMSAAAMPATANLSHTASGSTVPAASLRGLAG